MEFKSKEEVQKYIKIFEEKQTENDNIIFGNSQKFGNTLLINFDTQITQYDYTKYHDFIKDLGNLPNKDNILVLGDGDGGLTQYDFSNKITYIERSSYIMEKSKKYFGAKWNNTYKIINEDILNINQKDLCNDYDIIVICCNQFFNNNNLDYLQKILPKKNQEIIMYLYTDNLSNINNLKNNVKKFINNFQYFKIHTQYFESFNGNANFIKGVL